MLGAGAVEDIFRALMEPAVRAAAETVVHQIPVTPIPVVVAVVHRIILQSVVTVDRAL